MYRMAPELSSGLPQPLSALYMPLRHVQLGMQYSELLQVTPLCVLHHVEQNREPPLLQNT